MNAKFIFSSIIITLIQIVTGNFFWLSHLVSIALLPAVIISIPTRTSTPASLIFAFLLALFADLLTDGVLGLNAVALLPVALLRLWIVRIVFGRDIIVRGEDISIQRQGIAKMILALVLALFIFFAIYIWVDGAGTRSFAFNLSRFLISLPVSTLFGLLVVNILTSERSTRWR